jgi:N-acylglucosamine-6-phosphate 2-epimerase
LSKGEPLTKSYNLLTILSKIKTKLLEDLKSKLIVSCQAPIDSPLHDAEIIGAIAQACVNRGAAGVRIDTPAHIMAVRKKMPDIPIIGLWKQTGLVTPVYITPRYEDAETVAKAGADIIAIDATLRQRPQGEKVTEIIKKIHDRLGKLIMADIDDLESAIAAVEAGADLVGTTLYGYTSATKHLSPPGFTLLSELVEKLSVPIICEGGIASPAMAKQALDLGAYAVVVGTAITGIDALTQSFQTAVSDTL